jgi:hypothetical protein
MNEPRPTVIFQDELPVPTTNIEIYEQVYVLEQWFRRVAYASLMARYGSNWTATLRPGLLGDLKRRLRQLDGRVHLHCENSNNAIWLLTLDELRDVLLADATWPAVKVLTGLPRGVLDRKLDELREIRNVVGHNRATTLDTAVIVKGIAISLRPAITCFKDQLLYSMGDMHLDHGEGSDELVPSLFSGRVKGNDWSKFQPMLTESEYFYSLTRLPAGQFDRYLRIGQFLGEMTECEDAVLAVLVNLTGDEFTLTWSKAVSDVEHEQVVQFFFASHASAWTETDYEMQRASAVCDPRIWFYENRRPEDE